MIKTESAARFREALERREDEREQYRLRLARATSLRDYLDIQREGASHPQQETANLGYSHLKVRRR